MTLFELITFYLKCYYSLYSPTMKAVHFILICSFWSNSNSFKEILVFVLAYELRYNQFMVWISVTDPGFNQEGEGGWCWGSAGERSVKSVTADEQKFDKRRWKHTWRCWCRKQIQMHLQVVSCVDVERAGPGWLIGRFRRIPGGPPIFWAGVPVVNKIINIKIITFVNLLQKYTFHIPQLGHAIRWRAINQMDEGWNQMDEGPPQKINK